MMGMLSAGFYMVSLEPSKDKFYIYGIHKAFGVIMLISVLLRILWRFRNVTPELPESTPKWQSSAAYITHLVLYFFMLGMPLSGMLMSLYSGYSINVFDIFTVPAFEKKAKYAALFKELHNGFAIVLVVAILFHICAALYHHFIKKDNVLKRMIVNN